METNAKRLSVVTLATTAALTLTPCPALAQRGPMQAARPQTATNPAPTGIQLVGRGPFQSPALGTFNPGFQAANFNTGAAFAASRYASPYAGLNPYGLASLGSVNPYGTPYTTSAGLFGGAAYGAGSPYGTNGNYSYPDPYGGGLRGAAEAIDSQGRFEVQWQQSRLQAQEVERSKLQTRRMVYDEWLQEQALRPTLEDLRERSQAQELRRILRDPPLTDVVSGYALNVLLDNLRIRPDYARGPNIALDPTQLKQVTVSSGENGGNIGLLRSVREGAPLPWPLPLQGEAYQDTTRRLNKLAAEAVNLAQNGGPVAAGTLNDMAANVEALRARVGADIDELTPSQSVQARRFLSQLDDAILALKQPSVANYFTDKWTARGQTVPDLLSYLISHGLRFAPAVGGDEAAYSSLYNALLAYRNGLESELAREGGK
jgi:hypothetical protein